jgi:single-strand DNA-binding protein
MTIDGLELMATVLRAETHRFIGRLGRDPELRSFEGGSCVANVTMAVDRPDKRRDDGQEPDWFKLDAWNEDAVALVDQFHKGDVVEVVGRVKLERWTDRATGEEKSTLVVKVERISMVKAAAPKPPEGGAPAPPAAAPAQWATAAPVAAAAPGPAARPSPF